MSEFNSDTRCYEPQELHGKYLKKTSDVYTVEKRSNLDD